MCCDDGPAVIFPCLTVVGCKGNELGALPHPTITHSRPRDAIEVPGLQYLHGCRPVEMRREGAAICLFHFPDVQLKAPNSWRDSLHGVVAAAQNWCSEGTKTARSSDPGGFWLSQIDDEIECKTLLPMLVILVPVDGRSSIGWYDYLAPSLRHRKYRIPRIANSKYWYGCEVRWDENVIDDLRDRHEEFQAARLDGIVRTIQRFGSL